MSGSVEGDITVELHVPDFDAAVEFYDKLGFALMSRQNGELGYMVMRRSRSVIGFYGGSNKVYEHAYFQRYDTRTPRGYGVEIVIEVEEIDEVFRAIKSLRSEAIVEELVERPWGPRDFRLVDPFGFYLRITEKINWLVP
ncbi:MAG TPA: VOC family protein [Chloroflexia bacterium]|jgi:predicted enzyme related to lactoylglutathione lyase